MGLDRTPVERRGPDRTLPLITGAYGGHTIDFRDFAAQGAILLGRLESMSAGTLHFASDLADSLRSGDVAYTAFLDLVDGFVARQRLDVPEEPGARTLRADPGCAVSPVRHLKADTAGIGSVIWSTGYGCDFGWIDLPVFDGRGEPLHREGIADVPGLYFLGLQWLSRMNSSFLVGVAEDAARLADHIAARSSAKG
jgi:putative flavoprotein involved in K+ transport